MHTYMYVYVHTYHIRIHLHVHVHTHTRTHTHTACVDSKNCLHAYMPCAHTHAKTVPSRNNNGVCIYIYKHTRYTLYSCVYRMRQREKETEKIEKCTEKNEGERDKEFSMRCMN